jgi:hypothetical protein
MEELNSQSQVEQSPAQYESPETIQENWEKKRQETQAEIENTQSLIEEIKVEHHQLRVKLFKIHEEHGNKQSPKSQEILSSARNDFKSAEEKWTALENRLKSLNQELKDLPPPPFAERGTLRMEYAPLVEPSEPSSTQEAPTMVERSPRKVGDTLRIEPYTERGTLRLEHAPKVEEQELLQESVPSDVTIESPIPPRKEGGTLRMAEAIPAEQEKVKIAEVSAEDINNLLAILENKLPEPGSENYAESLVRATREIEDRLENTNWKGESIAMTVLDKQAIEKLMNIGRQLEQEYEKADDEHEQYRVSSKGDSLLALNMATPLTAEWKKLHDLSDKRRSIRETCKSLGRGLYVAGLFEDFRNNPNAFDNFIAEKKTIFQEAKKAGKHISMYAGPEFEATLKEIAKYKPEYKARFRQEGLL